MSSITRRRSKARTSVSIVVAARNPGNDIVDCLDAVVPQCREWDTECVVVGTGRRPAADLLERYAPVVRLVWLEQDQLIPMLWSHGVRATTTDVVALTTTDCSPADNWLEEIVNGPWDDVAAMGGALEVHARARRRSEAIVFQRYSSYLPPRDRGYVADLAADNAAYRRDSLISCSAQWQEAFWEPDVHRQLLARGERLLFNPSMVAYVCHHGPVSDMARQRYLHGWWFGAQRTNDASVTTRLLRVLSSPAIPLVLFVRIVRRLASKGRLSLRQLRSLPLLWVYLLSWSYGEFRGYLQGYPRSASKAVGE